MAQPALQQGGRSIVRLPYHKRQPTIFVNISTCRCSPMYRLQRATAADATSCLLNSISLVKNLTDAKLPMRKEERVSPSHAGWQEGGKGVKGACPLTAACLRFDAARCCTLPHRWLHPLGPVRRPGPGRRAAHVRQLQSAQQALSHAI